MAETLPLPPLPPLNLEPIPPVPAAAQPIRNRASYKPKKIFTGMFLTFDTTKKFDSESDPACIELRNKLRAALKKILSQKELHKYIVLMDKEARFTGEYFDPIETRFFTELGKQQHHVHAHVIISIPNRTSIKIDYLKIQAELQREIGLTSINSHYEPFKRKINPDFNLIEYMKSLTKLGAVVNNF